MKNGMYMIAPTPNVIIIIIPKIIANIKYIKNFFTSSMYRNPIPNIKNERIAASAGDFSSCIFGF